jgi:hypothetical protein
VPVEGARPVCLLHASTKKYSAPCRQGGQNPQRGSGRKRRYQAHLARAHGERVRSPPRAGARSLAYRDSMLHRILRSHSISVRSSAAISSCGRTSRPSVLARSNVRARRSAAQVLTLRAIPRVGVQIRDDHDGHSGVGVQPAPQHLGDKDECNRRFIRK